jgi:DivIVA domain-containing protein
MDHQSIEGIRSASFSMARRGYEKEEVDRYLRELADRLEQEAGARSGSEAVKRELDLVSEKTAGILAQAEESAQRLHAEAVREASAVLSKAREDAEAVRAAADARARQVRAAADEYARETRSGVDEEQRIQLEAQLGDLTRRRDEILSDLARIASELGRTVSDGPATNGAPVTEPADAEPARVPPAGA